MTIDLTAESVNSGGVWQVAHFVSVEKNSALPRWAALLKPALACGLRGNSCELV